MHGGSLTLDTKEERWSVFRRDQCMGTCTAMNREITITANESTALQRFRQYPKFTTITFVFCTQTTRGVGTESEDDFAVVKEAHGRKIPSLPVGNYNKVLKTMVGPWGLEPQTVSNLPPNPASVTVVGQCGS